jgi:catechol 2,3-dioxygenase-like lactoylglutathione lyase family enzyme
LTDATNPLHATRPVPITHIALRARDLDASVAFYQRYAGLHLVHERADDGIRVAWLAWRERDPEFVIVLLEVPHEPVVEPGACDHMGFAVISREEIDRIAALARSEGILKLGPKDAGSVVGYIAMVRDPSGNTCEFSYGQSITPSETDSR